VVSHPPVRSYLAPQPPQKRQHISDPIWGSTREEKYEHTLGMDMTPSVPSVRHTSIGTLTSVTPTPVLRCFPRLSHATTYGYGPFAPIENQRHNYQPEPYGRYHTPSWVRRTALLNRVGCHNRLHSPLPNPSPALVSYRPTSPFSLASALTIRWVR